MKEFFKRLRLPTPAFFVKVRNIGLSLIAIGAGIAMMKVEGSIILDLLKPLAGELIVIGTVISIVAQATARPEVPNKELPLS